LFSIQAVEYLKEDKEPRRELMLTINNPFQPHLKAQELDSLNILLVEFEDLFVEPNSLPPKRSLNYSIPLKPNTKLVNIRSYQ